MNDLNINPYNALKSLLEVTAPHLGEDFLKIICEELKILFSSELVFITEALDCNPTTKVKILYATNEGLPDSFELEGTPCKLVFEDKIIQITKGLHHNFEKSKETNFESFYGIPLHNNDLDCIGHIGIFSEKIRTIPNEIEDIALIFARRIQTEYERNILEKENQKYQIKLQNMIITDGLTNLYNRRHFDTTAKDILAQIKRNLTTATLVFFDIDNFKKINDTYGHEEGDNVLKYLAKTLEKNSREGVDFIFRVGGEEFAIISIDSNIKKSFKHVKRIKKYLKKDILENKHKITLSIGISKFKKTDKNYDKVYKKADDKMYQAKKSGKNCIVK